MTNCLYIVRHGETVFNRAARMQGRQDHTPLTKSGVEQAISVGEKLLEQLGPEPELDGRPGRRKHRRPGGILVGRRRTGPDLPGIRVRGSNGSHSSIRARAARGYRSTGPTGRRQDGRRAAKCPTTRIRTPDREPPSRRRGEAAFAGKLSP